MLSASSASTLNFVLLNTMCCVGPVNSPFVNTLPRFPNFVHSIPLKGKAVVFKIGGFLCWGGGAGGALGRETGGLGAFGFLGGALFVLFSTVDGLDMFPMLFDRWILSSLATDRCRSWLFDAGALSRASFKDASSFAVMSCVDLFDGLGLFWVVAVFFLGAAFGNGGVIAAALLIASSGSAFSVLTHI